MKKLRRASALALVALSLSGCFTPRYLGIEHPYGDNRYLDAYAGCYDAAVVAHGYSIPLLLGLGLSPGSPGWEIVTTTTIPIATIVMALGGTLAAPAIFLVSLGK